jgi:hypothetical protein
VDGAAHGYHCRTGRLQLCEGVGAVDGAVEGVVGAVPAADPPSATVITGFLSALPLTQVFQGIW